VSAEWIELVFGTGLPLAMATLH